MTRLSRTFLAVATALLVACGTVEAGVMGTVREVSETTVTVEPEAGTPAVGDGVEFFFNLTGSGDEVSVASGTVISSEGGVVKVKIENATGDVEKNHRARFIPGKGGTTVESSPTVTSPSPAAATSPVPSPEPTRTLPPSVPLPSVTPKSVTPPPVAQDPAVTQYVNKGIAQYSAGDMDGAIASFTAALQIAPGMALLYLNRANAYLYKPNFNAALADANKALELKVDKADDAYTIRGMARAGLGDLNSAIADCNRAIKLNPKNALAYNNRANNKLRVRDYSGALSDCNRSLALNPSSALPYYNRGFARTNLGDQPGALADWQKAVQMQPSFGAELNPKIQQLLALGVRPKQTGPSKSAPKVKRR